MNTTSTAKTANQDAMQQRQQAILQAASTIFAKHGYQAADVQKVADLAGVGKGTVYRHFESKEKLFRATLSKHLDCLREVVTQAQDAHEDPLAQLKAVWLAYLGYFDSNDEIVDLLRQEGAHFRDGEMSTYFVRLEENRDKWLSLFEAIQARYPAKAGISAEDMMEISGQLVHGAVVLAQGSQLKRGLAERVDLMMKIFTSGFVSDEAQPNLAI